MTRRQTKATEPKATEAELLLLLERRYAKSGNGGSGEYAFLTHVRNDGGFNASRTFDAVTVSLWPSRGYAIDVFEVKVSRSDWVRELKDPAKSEAAWSIGDRFWICATAGVVDPDELPHGWGLIEAHGAKITDEGLKGRKLRVVQAAAWHGAPVRESAKATIPRGLLVAMLRRAGAVPDQEMPSEKALAAAEKRGREAERTTYTTLLEQAREREHAATRAVRTFEQNAGVRIQPNDYVTEVQVAETARKIRAALADEGHQERVRHQLQRMRDDLQRAAEQIDAVMNQTVTL